MKRLYCALIALLLFTGILPMRKAAADLETASCSVSVGQSTAVTEPGDTVTVSVRVNVLTGLTSQIAIQLSDVAGMALTNVSVSSGWGVIVDLPSYVNVRGGPAAAGDSVTVNLTLAFAPDAHGAYLYEVYNVQYFDAVYDEPMSAGGGTAAFEVHTRSVEWVVDRAPTCTEEGRMVIRCVHGDYVYEEKPIDMLPHVPVEWEVLVPPTNKSTGIKVIRCLIGGEILDTGIIPILSETWPDNTACSLGVRFRDAFPALTGSWYMYTPVDLAADGTLDVPLLASNAYIIGMAHITVLDGNVSAAYEVTADKAVVKEEFMTFLTSLDSLVTVEPGEMTDQSLPFGVPVSVADALDGAGQAYFFMRLVVTYDIYADGVTRWYPGI